MVPMFSGNPVREHVSNGKALQSMLCRSCQTTSSDPLRDYTFPGKQLFVVKGLRELLNTVQQPLHVENVQ